MLRLLRSLWAWGWSLWSALGAFVFGWVILDRLLVRVLSEVAALYSSLALAALLAVVWFTLSHRAWRPERSPDSKG